MIIWSYRIITSSNLKNILKKTKYISCKMLELSQLKFIEVLNSQEVEALLNFFIIIIKN